MDVFFNPIFTRESNARDSNNRPSYTGPEKLTFQPKVNEEKFTFNPSEDGPKMSKGPEIKQEKDQMILVDFSMQSSELNNTSMISAVNQSQVDKNFFKNPLYLDNSLRGKPEPKLYFDDGRVDTYPVYQDFNFSADKQKQEAYSNAYQQSLSNRGDIPLNDFKVNSKEQSRSSNLSPEFEKSSHNPGQLLSKLEKNKSDRAFFESPRYEDKDIFKKTAEFKDLGFNNSSNNQERGTFGGPPITNKLPEIPEKVSAFDHGLGSPHNMTRSFDVDEKSVLLDVSRLKDKVIGALSKFKVQLTSSTPEDKGASDQRKKTLEKEYHEINKEFSQILDKYRDLSVSHITESGYVGQSANMSYLRTGGPNENEINNMMDLVGEFLDKFQPRVASQTGRENIKKQENEGILKASTEVISKGQNSEIRNFVKEGNYASVNTQYTSLKGSDYIKNDGKMAFNFTQEKGNEIYKEKNERNTYQHPEKSESQYKSERNTYQDKKYQFSDKNNYQNPEKTNSTTEKTTAKNPESYQNYEKQTQYSEKYQYPEKNVYQNTDKNNFPEKTSFNSKSSNNEGYYEKNSYNKNIIQEKNPPENIFSENNPNVYKNIEKPNYINPEKSGFEKNSIQNERNIYQNDKNIDNYGYKYERSTYQNPSNYEKNPYQNERSTFQNPLKNSYQYEQKPFDIYEKQPEKIINYQIPEKKSYEKLVPERTNFNEKHELINAPIKNPDFLSPGHVFNYANTSKNDKYLKESEKQYPDTYYQTEKFSNSPKKPSDHPKKSSKNTYELSPLEKIEDLKRQRKKEELEQSFLTIRNNVTVFDLDHTKMADLSYLSEVSMLTPPDKNQKFSVGNINNNKQVNPYRKKPQKVTIFGFSPKFTRFYKTKEELLLDRNESNNFELVCEKCEGVFRGYNWQKHREYCQGQRNKWEDNAGVNNFSMRVNEEQIMLTLNRLVQRISQNRSFFDKDLEARILYDIKMCLSQNLRDHLGNVVRKLTELIDFLLKTNGPALGYQIISRRLERLVEERNQQKKTNFHENICYAFEEIESDIEENRQKPKNHEYKPKFINNPEKVDANSFKKKKEEPIATEAEIKNYFFTEAVNLKFTLSVNHPKRKVLISDLYEEAREKGIKIEDFRRFIEGKLA